MIKFFILTALLVCSFAPFAQNAKVSWGDEFKLKKGSTDLDVITADNSGVYLSETHLALKNYFVVGASARVSASLVKLDNNLVEQYRTDFNDELKGKEFEFFMVFQNKLLMFATDYNKKEKELTLHVADIDKASGKLSGEWTLLANWIKDDKKDDIDFKMTYSEDSTKMILVSSIKGDEKNTYTIQEFNEKNQGSKPVSISNEFDGKTYQLEDLLYTKNKKIILVGRVYQYQEGKKKKDKYLDFSNYNIRIYNDKGKQLKEINTEVNGKWLISTKVMQEKGNDLVLAAFYSTEKKGGNINGMLVQRINAENGEIINTSDKELNTSLIAALDDDDPSDNDKEEESKEERKERERPDKLKDESDAFSKNMRFRNIFYTNDGIVILAEKYHAYTYTSSSYSPGMNGSAGSWRNTTYDVYECGDIMMCKTDMEGNINWLQIVPKQQREIIYQGSSSHPGTGISLSFNSFFGGYNLPFYSSFTAIQNTNNIHILFNDNPKNEKILQPGQKAKMTNRFGKSDCFILTLNTQTGNYTRHFLFHNNDIPTAMLRLGSIINKDLYIVGKEDKVFGKTKIALGKISVTN